MLFPLITGSTCLLIRGQLSANNVLYSTRDGGEPSHKCISQSYEGFFADKDKN